MKRLVLAMMIVGAVILGNAFLEGGAFGGEYVPMKAQYPVKLYGFIKFDASYDTARTSVGNYARWVESEVNAKNDDQFNATANQSRFGLKFNGPGFGDGGETRGRVEIDFYGGGAENKANPMMRHAYMELDWTESDFIILAGQTSDVISPLVPSTLNYTVCWWVGNPGYRRPQLRFTKGFGDDGDVLFQLAATRTLGDDALYDPGDTGEDAGFPTTQGRIAFSFDMLTDNKTTLGVSGHWGEEEYDITNTDSSKDVETWSGNVDLTMPLSEKMTLKGEYMTGANLDSYLGGIGQGIVVTTDDSGVVTNIEEIKVWGGWGQLALGPWDDWRLHLGYAMDNPSDKYLADGARSRNEVYFGNVLYDVNTAVKVGLEVSSWDTEYKNTEDADSMRYQGSFIYKF